MKTILVPFIFCCVGLSIQAKAQSFCGHLFTGDAFFEPEVVLVEAAAASAVPTANADLREYLSPNRFFRAMVPEGNIVEIRGPNNQVFKIFGPEEDNYHGHFDQSSRFWIMPHNPGRVLVWNFLSRDPNLSSIPFEITISVDAFNLKVEVIREKTFPVYDNIRIQYNIMKDMRRYLVVIEVNFATKQITTKMEPEGST